AAFGNLHRAVVGKAQLPGDGYYHHLATAHRIAMTRRIDMPLAVTADRLRQCRLETRVDMLGVDEADGQSARQGIEEGLHSLRATQRGRQQPYLTCRLARFQRG